MKQGGLADLSRAQARLAAAVPGTAVANGAGDGDASGMRASRRWTAIVESIAIGVLLPGVGLLVNREDPFFATRSFSWYVLPPLLAGLRHGFAAACASAAALGAAMLLGWRMHVFGGAELPGEALIGMFMVAMLTGHVSDVWLRETLRTRVTIDHARRRANEIARAHFLWQISHERLQEQSPGVASLQDALERIGDLARGRSSLDWPAVAQQAVTMAGRFASVETASLIRTTPSGVLSQVLAVLGEPRPVPPTDPMVLDAIQSREIASVAGPRANAAIAAGTRPGQTSRLLAAVPVLDSAGLLHGVLCVESLPFFAFTRQNIESLAVLMGRVADLVSKGGHVADPHVERQQIFLERLDRALEDCRLKNARAALGVLAVVRGSPLARITDVILSGILAPNHVIHRTGGGTGDTLIWFLLPGASEADVRTTMARIESLIWQKLERSLAQAGGTAAFRFLEPADERRTVMGDLERGVEARRGHP